MVKLDARIKKPGGSLTALPIIETQAGDVSAYIPTNVISITDGQIFLDHRPLLLQRPSRGGRRHQREPGGWQRADQGDEAGGRSAAACRWRSTASSRRLPSSAPSSTPPRSAQLARGARTVEVLKQPQYSPVPVERQVAIIFAATNGFLDDVEVKSIRKWEADFLTYLEAQHPAVLQGIRTKRTLDEDLTESSRPRLPPSSRCSGPSKWPSLRVRSGDGCAPCRTPARSRGRWNWSPRPSSSGPRIASCRLDPMRRRWPKSSPIW